MKSKFSVILLLVIAALAGCSGSSSSGSSSTASGTAPLATVTINSTNAPTVTAAAFASASLKVNSLSPLGVQTTTSSTDDRILYQVNDFAMKKIAEHQNTSASAIGATTTTSYSCIAGDVTSGTFAFTYDTPTSTYITATFTNCKLSSSSTTTVNGTFSVTGASVTTTTQSATVSINLTITTTGYSTIKYVGGYTLAATGVTTTTRKDALTGSSLVFSLGSLNESLSNFSFSTTYDDLPNTTPSSYSDSVSYTISSDFTGGSFTFATITPIVRNYGELYPHSGKVEISGANSSKLRATILATTGSNIAGTSSGQISLEISTDNGSSWTLLSTQTWATL